MELLDVLTVVYGTEARTIELYRGDLTNLPTHETVDILVVSAFPNSYLPISGTLIGSLYRRGVSVEELAKNKAVDLCSICSAWLSHELIAPPEGIAFKRILCFEPPIFGNITEVVGDIFRSLAPVLAIGDPVSVAMPLMTTSNRDEPVNQVVTALLDAATQWMRLGLPVRRLKLFEQSAPKAAALKQAFARLKAQYQTEPLPPRSIQQDNVFISYSKQDSSDKAYLIAAELRQERPDMNIFLDRQALNPATAWQQQIYDTIDRSHTMIALYSPAYLRSKACQEEFNVAFYRHRTVGEPRLVPICLYSAQLPDYMKLLPSADCREGDDQRLRAVCAEILATFNS
ncbi:MAG TPA: toll/interleukin-1 receptor domain-containing protein [Herpetosiphonaceae bacterium]